MLLMTLVHDFIGGISFKSRLPKVKAMEISACCSPFKTIVQSYDPVQFLFLKRGWLLLFSSALTSGEIYRPTFPFVRPGFQLTFGAVFTMQVLQQQGAGICQNNEAQRKLKYTAYNYVDCHYSPCCL